MNNEQADCATLCFSGAALIEDSYGSIPDAITVADLCRIGGVLLDTTSERETAAAFGVVYVEVMAQRFGEDRNAWPEGFREAPRYSEVDIDGD